MHRTSAHLLSKELMTRPLTPKVTISPASSFNCCGRKVLPFLPLPHSTGKQLLKPEEARDRKVNSVYEFSSGDTTLCVRIFLVTASKVLTS
ncbi:hypothetical protein CEXT_261911 [Caerostris extrusa]|uniref:Uncharacterized protein n=1 Tax=Caerostris extrusa TaxID=172846 RepID=A0AAV4T0U3_CAEEX|nr:hypothetical protein CEXT_261911 [Caerostris extrusa]